MKLQKTFTSIVMVACVGWAAFMPIPARAADATKGEVLARRWCASCHVVAPDQSAASTQAPSFASIARRPDFSAGQIALFLLDPHPKMPDMALSRSEAADLAAYIALQAK